MKTYLLKRLTPVRWDECEGFVICAASPRAARKLASEHAADERASVWLDPQLSSCEQITSEHDAGVILGAFNAG
jgi:hypothetical protein